MSLHSRIAPSPESPHASFFSTGLNTSIQPSPFSPMPHSSSRIFICFLVTGCFHIAVFIAGATTIRFFLLPSISPVVSQALTTDNRRLSAKPKVILAKELADRGAITSKSAHLRNSICNIFPPLIHGLSHSSSSRYIPSMFFTCRSEPRSGCSSLWPARKCSADLVTIIRTDRSV